MNYEGSDVTYFPLTVNSDRTANTGNTGYIVSGSDDQTTSDTFPRKSGDIRVSRYETSNI